MEFLGYQLSLSRLFKTDRRPDLPGDPVDPLTIGKSEDDYDSNDPRDGLRNWMNGQFDVPNDRKERYKLYELMDKTDLPAGVADLVTEDACQEDPSTKDIIWIDSKDEELREIGANLFKQIEANIRCVAICRDLFVKGDVFERLIYASQGVSNHIPAPESQVSVKVDKFGTLQGFFQDGKKFRSKNKENADSLSFPWDFIHFKLPGKYSRTSLSGCYGTSGLHNALRPWRQGIMAEDEALMYRLSRRPDRLLWEIDTGEADYAKKWKICKDFETRIKKKTFIDPSTGRFDHQMNPVTSTEDIFLPKSANSTTAVNPLGGNAAGVTEVGDLEYYNGKFFSAVRVPKLYFGFGEDTTVYNPKGLLSNQSVRYSRLVKKVQNALKDGYRRIFQIHLSLLDPNKERWDVEDPDLFSVEMSIPSYLAEMEILDVSNIRSQLAASYFNMVIQSPVVNIEGWTKYILEEILKLPPRVMRRVLTKAPEGVKTPFDVNMGPSGAAGAEDQRALDNELRSASFAPPEEEEAPAPEPEIKKENLSPEEIRFINEAIEKSPELSRSIQIGKRIWEPEQRSFKTQPVPQRDKYEDTVEND